MNNQQINDQPTSESTNHNFRTILDEIEEACKGIDVKIVFRMYDLASDAYMLGYVDRAKDIRNKD